MTKTSTLVASIALLASVIAPAAQATAQRGDTIPFPRVAGDTIPFPRAAVSQKDTVPFPRSSITSDLLQ